MLLCSALYYSGSLAKPETLVRDNRFYGGKAVETFPVWWAYVRRHYSDVPVVLFADSKSPIPWQDVISLHVKEAVSVCTPDSPLMGAELPPITIVPLTKHTNRYFWAMQRNLVEAINLAYRLNEDLFWLDNDAFLNTNIRPLLNGCDVANSNVESHQMTMGSVCFYLSARRLHALDTLVDLPTFLSTMLAEGPTETRMHLLQEGGLYKLFAYGDVRDLGAQIQLAHLSCYDRFITFLRRNPLDTPEYRALIAALETVDWTKMPGVQRAFWDMLYPDNASAPQ